MKAIEGCVCLNYFFQKFAYGEVFLERLLIKYACVLACTNMDLWESKVLIHSCQPQPSPQTCCTPRLQHSDRHSQSQLKSGPRAPHPPDRGRAADRPRREGSVCLPQIYSSRITHTYSRATKWLSAFSGLLIRKSASHTYQWR